MELPSLPARRKATYGQREMHMRSRWGLRGVECFASIAAMSIVFATLAAAPGKIRRPKISRRLENRRPPEAAATPASLTAKASPHVAVPDPIYGNPLGPGHDEAGGKRDSDRVADAGRLRRFRPLPELFGGRLYIARRRTPVRS